jgi:hypothetical protein
MTEPTIKNRKNSIKLVKSLDQKIYKSYSPFTGNIKMMMGHSLSRVVVPATLGTTTLDRE